MNIHEYQAKEVLKEFGVAVPEGVAGFTAEEAVKAAERLGRGTVVVKAQIHAGGRGKGGRRQGGEVARARFAPRRERMLGLNLVTKQTGPEGKVVNRVYIEEASTSRGNFISRCLIDRATSRVPFIASTEGGMDIEEVAARHAGEDRRPSPSVPPPATAAMSRRLASALKLEGEQAKQCGRLVERLYRAFLDKDMSLLEINPLIVTEGRTAPVPRREDQFRRQCAVPPSGHHGAARRDEEDPRGARSPQARSLLCRARRQHRLHGQRRGACHGDHGHHQALWRGARQFPRCRRRRSKEKVAAAFKIITADTKVKGILVNIFGGIMRCDMIAEGVIAAVREVGLKVPLVVRLEGTNADLGQARC